MKCKATGCNNESDNTNDFVDGVCRGCDEAWSDIQRNEGSN